MEAPVLKDSDYKTISDMVYRHSRIHLGDAKKELVTSRLGKRLRATGCATYSDYCEFISGLSGDEEINHLIDAISTNHTFFFREKKHFEFLESSVFENFENEKIFRGDGIFRCWSAAASTGEEPYSIAMTLERHALVRKGFRWSMVCSDISHTALETAKAGIYPESRLDDLDQQLKKTFFQKGVGSQAGYCRVKKDLRDKISWHRMNLFQETYPFEGVFHVIFCRNVMIYFDRPSQELLVNRLSRMLIPGGYLKVGHSESLSTIRHSLQSVRPAVYRRTL